MLDFNFVKLFSFNLFKVGWNIKSLWIPYVKDKKKNQSKLNSKANLHP